MTACIARFRGGNVITVAAPGLFFKEKYPSTLFLICYFGPIKLDVDPSDFVRLKRIEISSSWSWAEL